MIFRSLLDEVNTRTARMPQGGGQAGADVFNHEMKDNVNFIRDHVVKVYQLSQVKNFCNHLMSFDRIMIISGLIYRQMKLFSVASPISSIWQLTLWQMYWCPWRNKLNHPSFWNVLDFLIMIHDIAKSVWFSKFTWNIKTFKVESLLGSVWFESPLTAGASPCTVRLPANWNSSFRLNFHYFMRPLNKICCSRPKESFVNVHCGSYDFISLLY